MKRTGDRTSPINIRKFERVEVRDCSLYPLDSKTNKWSKLSSWNGKTIVMEL